jgi:carbonic anhydrase/acetyltransferase-like protein (isoleucine patch superfamily)
VDPSAQVIGDVHLGEEASIWCNCTVRGDIHYIRIGDRANIQDNSVIHVRHGSHPTIVEEEVTVGHSVTLHGCYVERGSLVGIGAVVLDDVRIGELSLVAAGSLVSDGFSSQGQTATHRRRSRVAGALLAELRRLHARVSKRGEH